DPSGELLPPLRLTHLYVDINNLKWANDNLGHHVGDRAIIGAAAGIQQIFRNVDTPIAYRLGGDEFGVVLVNTGDAEVNAAGELVTNTYLGVIKSGRYKNGMQAVAHKVRRIQQCGERVRTEAIGHRTVEAGGVPGKQLRHTLYINGEAVAVLS